MIFQRKNKNYALSIIINGLDLFKKKELKKLKEDINLMIRELKKEIDLKW